MQISTSRFGTIEVKPEELLFFPGGVPAFEHLQEFFLHPIPENPAFTWLQAVADPEVAFLLADPFLFFPGYAVELPASLQEELAIKKPADALVYAVVTIPDGDIRRATANLVGPMVINPIARRGMQIILEGTKYTTRHRLFKESMLNPNA